VAEGADMADAAGAAVPAGASDRGSAVVLQPETSATDAARAAAVTVRTLTLPADALRLRWATGKPSDSRQAGAAATGCRTKSRRAAETFGSGATAGSEPMIAEWRRCEDDR
jgi:hypothetical protein